MSGVPYTFGSATTSIPLSELDANFNTGLTLGTTTVGLGNTTTSIVGLANVSSTTIQSTSDATIHGLTVGQGAGSVSTNTAVGVNALSSNSSGTQSTGVGANALQYQTNNNNTAFGYNALLGVSGSSNGGSNTGIGSNALAGLTSGNYNTAIGQQSLVANTTAGNNTAVGFQAGYSNVGAGALTFVGYQAGYSTTTTGGSGTAVGYSALYSNTTGGNNTAIGRESLYSNTTANNNTAVGFQALYNANRISDASANNTAIGYQAGQAITTGARNTCIGTSSGTGSSLTGTENIYLGWNAYNSSGSVSNEIAIGSVSTVGLYGKGSNTAFISANGGSTYNGANSSSWATTSDNRLKKNIVDYSGGLTNILKLQVRNYEYRLPTEVDPTLKPTDAVNITGVQIGYIAQEYQTVYPNSVTTESTGVLSINHDNTLYDLVQAVQQLNALVVAQQATITTMQGQITALQAKVGV